MSRTTETTEDLGFTPLEKLLTAVINSAIAEKDKEYFVSTTFEKHCDILGLDAHLITERLYDRGFFG